MWHMCRESALGRRIGSVCAPSRPTLYKKFRCAAISRTQISYGCLVTTPIRRATATGSCSCRCASSSFSVAFRGDVCTPEEFQIGDVTWQEFLPGKALDEQLYQEGWQPTALQTLKAAIDIARGME